MQTQAKQRTAHASFVHSKLVVVCRRTIARRKTRTLATLDTGRLAARCLPNGCRNNLRNRNRALIDLGSRRGNHEESDDDAKDEPKPPRDPVCRLGLQDGARLLRNLEDLGQKRRQNIDNRIRGRLRVRRIREFLKEAHRFLAEVVLLGRALHGQVRELRTTTDGRLPVLLQEGVGLKETLVKRNILGNLHRVHHFHLLGIVAYPII